VREINKDRIAQLHARSAAREQRSGNPERLSERADALTSRAAALKRLADAEKPLYQSLHEAQLGPRTDLVHQLRRIRIERVS
jgi:hypothetical protein